MCNRCVERLAQREFKRKDPTGNQQVGVQQEFVIALLKVQNQKVFVCFFADMLSQNSSSGAPHADFKPP